MNIQAEKAAIQNVVTAFAHTLNAGNKGALRDFFAQDGLFMPEGFKSIPSSRLTGPTDFLIRANFQIAFTPEDIVIDGCYGFARFTALTNMRNPETGTPTWKKSKDFFVFRKEQDHWKIYRYMFNNVKEI
jgi:ketosteroid isomerase-like protein